MVGLSFVIPSHLLVFRERFAGRGVPLGVPFQGVSLKFHLPSVWSEPHEFLNEVIIAGGRLRNGITSVCRLLYNEQQTGHEPTSKGVLWNCSNEPIRCARSQHCEGSIGDFKETTPLSVVLPLVRRVE